MSNNSLNPRIPAQSFFPSGKRYSMANSTYQYRMSIRSLQALGTENTTQTYQNVKTARLGKTIKGRHIALSSGGVRSQSAQTLGSMDRLARLKAQAIGKSSGKSSI